jgi:hypothetical protein
MTPTASVLASATLQNLISDVRNGSNIPDGWEIYLPGESFTLGPDDARVDYGVPGKEPFLTLVRRADAVQQHLVVRYHFTFIDTHKRIKKFMVKQYVKHFGLRGLTMMKGE